MFGRRADGCLVKSVDPIIRFTPHIMPTRVDAQVSIRLKLDFDIMTNYIRAQRAKGHNITYMGLILAAYVRTIAKYPALNRFVVNKKLYARNHFCVSFVTLKKNDRDEVKESLVKVGYQPSATVFEVCELLEKAIAENREETQSNLTDTLSNTLLSIPLLPQFAMIIIRFLERYGLLPMSVYKASPFHTGLFISNMASIGMGYIYHHIYNFGTTSVFISMGKTEDELLMNPDGTCRRRRIMPLGVVIDERIASGGVYAQGLGYLQHCLSHPETLETPPETVNLETAMIDPDVHINNR